MIIAKGKKEVERRSANDPYGQIENFEVELNTIDEVERFLAYNRYYIREIKFVGVIKKEEE